MTKERGESVSKRVDYLEKDADEQTATGVVMVPWTVDHHGDWERPSTIEDFSDQFDAFMDAGEADGGVMHAVWPSEWMTLERNDILEESTEIGGQEVPEGAWVQTWKYNDDELWSLVDDGVLEGHSIGAVDVEWEYNGDDPEELPDDVNVPDEVDVEDFWELTDGIVREVSAVDIPAVPDAQILEASKARAAATQKRLADHLGNRDGFIEEAMERGHSEEEAERMWDLLNRAVNVEGAGEPGAKSRLTNAAKAFMNALTGGDTPAGVDVGGEAQTGKNAPEGDTSDDDGGTEAAADDDMSDGDNEPPEWAQELKAQVEEQSERLDAALDEDGEDGSEKDGGDAFEEAPEWAQALKEDVDKQAERIDAISKQTGATDSQQLGGAEKSGAEDGVDERAAFFTPESKMHELAAEGSRGEN